MPARITRTLSGLQNDMQPQKQKFNVASMLLIAAAAPIWIYLSVVLPQSPGFGGSPTRFLIPPIALAGIAFAVHRLFRGKRNSIAISVLLSPVIAWGVLNIASFLAG